MGSKRIIIIAGPNGAGKTTFAQEFLPREAECPEFVNADLIAAGLSPFDPKRVAIKAGRIMLNRINELVKQGSDFAFETTLATKGYRRLIPQWQQSGYRVILYFLKLPDAEMAVRRVARRVQYGGHDIPVPTIRRRFERGRENLQRDYLGLVDEWIIYDAARIPPRRIEQYPAPLDSSGIVMEDPQTSNDVKVSSMVIEDTDRYIAGADAAFIRAAKKIIDRDRAAGLEPIASDQYKSAP